MREREGQGKLLLVATPIGNLDDMTFRAVRALQEADLIAAEDTRNTIRLLNHFDIHTPMTSYHEYNRIGKAHELVEKMLEGKTVALVTDAGTPGISDPGEDLVRIAAEAGIEITSLPGACACITALTLSALPTRRFCFEAFLPRNKKERQEILDQLVNETRTIILYEAPHHLRETLEQLSGVLGDRRITLCRELTKIHEEARRTTLHEALKQLEQESPRGEYVIVLEGRNKEDLLSESRKKWEDLTVGEHVRLYEQQGMDRKEAMRAAAKDRGLSRRDIYQMLEAAKDRSDE